MEECPLFHSQLQLLLSYRSAKWPLETYKLLSRQDWLLPCHCIGRFAGSVRLIIEQCPADDQVWLWARKIHLCRVLTRANIIRPGAMPSPSPIPLEATHSASCNGKETLVGGEVRAHDSQGCPSEPVFFI